MRRGGNRQAHGVVSGAVRQLDSGVWIARVVAVWNRPRNRTTGAQFLTGSVPLFLASAAGKKGRSGGALRHGSCSTFRGNESERDGIMLAALLAAESVDSAQN